MLNTLLNHRSTRLITLSLLVAMSLVTCNFNRLKRESWASNKPLSIPTNGDLWQAIATNFGLLDDTTAQEPAVRRQIHNYLARKTYLNKIIQRAKPYLFYIYQQTRKRHLPAELALLPFIESEYSPFAYSHTGATGLWQIMPGTATGFGVTINWWFDGRRDLIEGTRAALNYLTYLHDYLHNDWLLAIAAYNSGEGKVMEAMRENLQHRRSARFWSLHLPAETQAYIPKLLALSIIIKNPEHYHLHLPPINNAPYLVPVQINSQMGMVKAAQLASFPVERLYQLNAGFRRWKTAPKTPTLLLMPLNYARRLQKKLSALPKKYRHSLKQQRHAVKTRNSIISEDKLPGPQLIHHRIKRGESLPSIAKQHGVTTGQLEFWNNLKYPYRLQAGKTILLWKHPQKNYRVKNGDSLLRIALKFKLSLSQLKKLNKIDEDDDFIAAGEILTVGAR